MQNFDITTGAEKSAPEFVLRDLKAMDVWQLVRILTKLGLKDLRKSIDPDLLRKSDWKPPTMMDAEGNEVPLPRDKWTERQIDAEMAAEMANDELLWSILDILMSNIENCEYDVNKLLAMGTGKTPEAIREMDANDYMELIVTYITREGFRDFFMHAWKLLRGASNLKKSSSDAIAVLTR